MLPADERLLVGIDTSDDAGVLRLDDRTALILTVDFFSPIVDDPYNFGAIAAVNALSDVYAMGGKPLAALNIAAFPPKEDKAILRAVLQGGADKVKEAGAVIAGGHSVRDDELKYGLAVVGLVHPDAVIRNAGALPGDRLVLTKPIGTGLLTTARRADAVTAADLEPATSQMLALNRDAAAAMVRVQAHAATDVTGFGLLGHAQEMACASGVGFAIDRAEVPLLARARECATRGFIPAGARNNRSHFGPFVQGDLTEADWAVLFDPQTSGGLLISVAPAKSDALVSILRDQGINAAIIGEVLPEPKARIILR